MSRSQAPAGCVHAHTQWAAGPDGTQEDLSVRENEKISPRSTLHVQLEMFELFLLVPEASEDN